ncbi:N-acetyltransferase [Aureimonas endophytica]|uniref:N-acetyltransferase n=1 Tax=Aureimonas endophytica TaxID=2027858 RepID=A0A917E0M3_9HYPH|nr:GNAT family N-acetyltransferase [Aureimonas endophytica]GGD88444.1 N-acetyltransferase [Aureimonas endophytica]
MSVAIRPAGEDDLEALRLLLKETWHATYDAIYGAEDVDRLTAEWHSIESMEQRLTRPHSRFLVAVVGDAIAGMAFAAEEEPRIVFLHQLYVLPERQGGGIGSALLAAVEQGFVGCERMRLDVEVANRPAVTFYERHGFSALGLEAETKVPKMLRMERVLSER